MSSSRRRWSPGLTIAVLLIVVIRPVLVGIVTLPIRLTWGERAFVLWAGLKGAVPILLGMFILSADVAGGETLYAIIFIVVLISVVVQGGLVPVFARLFHVPMRLEHPRPWTVDVRFAEEPDGLQRHTVEPGSPADGSTIEELSDRRARLDQRHQPRRPQPAGPQHHPAAGR